MIVFVAVAPTRVTPRAMTSSSASSVRTPPAALTWTWARRSAHQRQVLVGRAAGREPGRGLDEVGAGRLGQLAGADLLVVGQVGVLEDDLDDRAGAVGDLDDRRDVRPDVGVAAGLQRADLDDHVELGRAVGQRSLGLEDLRRGHGVAVREADHGPDRDVRAARIAAARRTSAGRTQTDATSYSSGEPAAGLDERVVELGPQQRVVDRLGDVALGQGLDGEGHVAHLMYGRRTSRASRKPRLTRSSVFSKSRSSCSMITSPS